MEHYVYEELPNNNESANMQDGSIQLSDLRSAHNTLDEAAKWALKMVKSWHYNTGVKKVYHIYYHGIEEVKIVLP